MTSRFLTVSFALGSAGLVAAASITAVVLHSGGAHNAPTKVLGEFFANTAKTVPGGNLSIGPQAMDGKASAQPGQFLRAGYDFTMPGKHDAATFYFSQASVRFAATCSSDKKAPTQDVRVDIADSVPGYADPANSSSWLPSGDQNDPSTYQGSVQVPNICSGGPVYFQNGGTFTALVQSKNTADKINVRWHYTVNAVGGGWSGTASVLAAYPSGTFTMAGDQPNLLVGDENGSLPLTLTNPNPFPINILTASAAVTDTPAGCPASWLTLNSYAYTNGAKITVPAESTTSTALSLPVQFPDRASDNQTQCLGQPYTLSYQGSAEAAGS